MGRRRSDESADAAQAGTGRRRGVPWRLLTRTGEAVDVPFTDDGLFADPVRCEHLTMRQHTDTLQTVHGPTSQVLLGGVRVYREKKGKVLKQGSFTWRRGEPLAQIRQVATMVKRTMIIEGLRQEEKDYAPFRNELSWEGERYAAVLEALQAVDYEHGAIVGMEAYVPRVSRVPRSPDEVPCFVCSR